MDPDFRPQQLLNKVQFDVHFYLCRRGSENFHSMEKEDFAPEYDEDTNIAYVRKVKDELTKNHKDLDIDITSGFMTQVMGSDGRPHKLCPVCSFENYLNHLNPKCKSLWQQPRRSVKREDNIWYISRRLGHNPLDIFLPMMSEICELSQHYTNHCIRVSGITNFKRNQCSDRQVMAISGHKRLQSLALYTRVHDDEKLMMGLKLTFSLLQPEQARQLRETNEESLQALEPNPETTEPLPKRL